jgi:hypothetical protein
VTRFRHEALLARTFFFRFFENDVLPAGIAPARLVFSGLVALAVPMYLLTFVFLMKYEQLNAFRPARLPMAMFLDELVFVTVSMIGLGAVALLSWDGVFPDRRDARTFGVLPLSTRAIVTGKLAALGALALLFAVGPNLLAGVLYGTILWMYGGAANPIRGIAAHVIAPAGAGLFVFFTLIAIQGVLLAVLGRRLAQRLTLLFQTLFVVLLLQTLLFLPYLRAVAGRAFGPPPTGDARWLPPAWFLSLYDAIAGTDRAVSAGDVLVAAGATAAAMLSAVLLIALSYRRLARQALETPDLGPRRWRRLRSGAGLAAGALTRHPVARGVAAFTLQTLRRSRTHLVLLSTYGGVAAAIVISTLIPVLATVGATSTFAAPGLTLLSIPLVFNFLLIAGARVLFGIPTELGANWLFRLHVSDHDAPRAVAGAQVALLTGIALGIAVLTATAGALLWDVRTGAIHGAFTLLAGWLLAELLVVDFRSVPFTRIYTPGHWRVKGLWPLYVLAFTAYAWWLAALAAAALVRPSLLLLFAGIVVFVAIAARLRRRRAFRAAPGLTFVGEEVDAMFAGFGLSESIAADARRTMFPRARSGKPPAES